MMEKYLGTNRSKEMKVKNLLKFSEEDCKIEDLCIILEILHFSVLSFWPFSQHKNSLPWRRGEMGEGGRLLV